MSKSLPVINEPASSLNKDGSRNFVQPADVKGRFTRFRYVVFAALIVIYLALPFIQINDRPAVFLDLPHRRFYLFGSSFNAQDFWLFFFLLTGLAFLLFVVTTLFGRVWCGYACPQTVFLEGVYRRIERFIEGPRNARIKRNAGPMNGDKLWRKGLKHVLFILLSLFFAHFFLSYFVSLPSMLEMIGGPPSDHPEAFAWMAGMSIVLYFNFAWFREQLCLIICPYGRLQSTLLDDDTLIIGYDVDRGEPRGKKSKKQPEKEVGDCIDCKRCVNVCPTGIDIRNGLQMECIGCAACIDACDEVMDKLGRDRGLVRYDTQKALEGGVRRFFRPRLLIYAGILVLWVVGVTFAFRSHEPFAANLLRPGGGEPFVVEDGIVRNTVQIHVVNKTDGEVTYTLSTPDEEGALEYVFPMAEVSLDGGGSRHVPVIVRLPREEMAEAPPIRVQVAPEDGDGDPRQLEATFLGPH
ncbi:MAG TPA: cytochrome c oxidase accessory protein CcoG [Polyangiaceae bacterium LLY-WYZ-15_(1-7)]|nr:cytochrome c oxidase accessory protein CcoG [Myxococcales bacterium]MAT29979.1 cytochrome c oxidase accessory protein CcoG [Sandaracinus sp.]HJK91903.1 cytochrome c oxidase accessory protein CcoG [Polyangiaceae bacterium LLY-WYZ-15_(1-7)]MBJ71533.1 cytochrome c oxidase accessory protein CcoG [Sandaracinus sp.]HJL00871.1 cytochrome c oxidase accessory protein CcoG [Polyangiaceae bacterium LLY-WYZ-15_(1-7)]